MSSNNLQISIMLSIKVPPQSLRPNKSNKNNISKNTPHKNTNHLPILIAMLRRLSRRQGEPLTNSRLNSRTSRGNKISKLVSRSNSERADRAGRQLHQVDGDY